MTPNNNNIPNNYQGPIESDSLNLKQEFNRYLIHWRWVILSVIIALSLGYIYLRYTAKVYETTAKIKILKKKESGMDLTGLTSSAPMFDMTQVNLDNEVAIIKSRRIVGRVVDRLQLTTNYFIRGRVIDEEIFGAQLPVNVSWLNEDKRKIKGLYSFTSIDENSFEINIEEISFSKVFKFGEEIVINDVKFVVHKTLYHDTNKFILNKTPIFFSYTPRKVIINVLLNSINATQLGDKSEVLQISLSGQNTLKNEAIVDVLVEEFNDDGITDDQKIAKATIEFVNLRINELESELDSVETNLVGFKKENNFIDIGTGTGTADQIFNTYSTAEQRSADIKTQLNVANFLLEDIKTNTNFTLLPSGGAGIENNSTINLIAKYNEAVQERNRQLVSSNENSPTIIALTENLVRLNSNIKNSLENYINTLQISLDNISIRENRYNSSIKSLPEKEKVVQKIQRQKSVKENLYIFLLQKQVEADLSAAITAPSAKIVDYAFTPSFPISPKPNIVYLLMFILGLALPLGILYLTFLFDTKITSKEQIKEKLNVPIIAEIPLNKEYNSKIIKNTDNSNVAEAFRILRTNINYLNINKDKSKAKVFFSTSSTKGEGKTFTAINIASTLAAYKHKVLLIGSDLRNPQIHNYLKISKKTIGLSSYLSNTDLSIDDIILKSEKVNINFDIILSGEIPPNPSELLHNGRLDELIDVAKEKYDYIIIDTAPTMLVTDTLSIIHLADSVIYMVRANYTELKILNHINDLVNINKQNNIAIAINGVEARKGYDYNYGYGYGYSEEKKKKKWYQFK